MHVSFADSGWNLRFARPMGDHLIAATLYDGIVVQPRMVATPLKNEAETPVAAPISHAASSPVPTASAVPVPGVPVVEPVHLPTSPN
jgi:hypothetical protein